jgi:hypothetical protein
MPFHEELEPEHLIVGEELAKGSGGVVLLATYKGRKVVLKRVYEGQKSLLDARSEASVLSLVPYLSLTLSPSDVFFFLFLFFFFSALSLLSFSNSASLSSLSLSRTLFLEFSVLRRSLFSIFFTSPGFVDHARTLTSPTCHFLCVYVYCLFVCFVLFCFVCFSSHTLTSCTVWLRHCLHEGSHWWCSSTPNWEVYITNCTR